MDRTGDACFVLLGFRSVTEPVATVGNQLFHATILPPPGHFRYYTIRVMAIIESCQGHGVAGA